MIDLAGVIADLADQKLTRIRRVTTVNEFGETETTEHTKSFRGVVTYPRPETIEREVDATQLTGAIRVHSELDLSDDAKQPDLVEWQRQRYTVASVKNYEHYGFCLADCTLRAVSGHE